MPSSPGRSASSKRSSSKSPARTQQNANSKRTPSKSGKKIGSAMSQGKKSMTSAKSVSSLQSRLLSAKKSTPEDNKPKKVMMRTPDLEALNLRTEDLSFSGLTQLPTEMFIAADTIGELDISGNNLRSIPADIWKLHELRALNLSQNSIKSTSASDYSGLPKDLAKLKHLQIVAISECNLRYVPAVLFECIAITRLDLSRNKFQMLPPEIGNLVDLEYLNMSETSIKSLPPEIAFCEKLQELNMYGNILEMLPETMRELHELTELKINARSFHSNLDDYMNKLLRNGNIKSQHIPSVLFDIPELRTLIWMVPGSTVYLRKTVIKRTEHLQPVKLILLGQQGCGKTTLNRTISSAAKCPTSSDNTQKASLHNYLSAEEKSNLMKRLPEMS
ncbi:hypothetical protein EB796_022215 [Bugula neritina]|uniref:Uncharacterized protein n=1 Tax=Bugula neritina TaxID=10212 RepID=A0A7J7J033_BUGNE|nr:hypothetical protein EB796_022215 [Bugula neritina]